ncbi:MAG: hypothetical protein R2710_08560 [Acidimicrobiales bacterium]
MATIAEDGTLVLFGRGSNCINTGGEKVYPEEVEEAIKVHDAVEDALVFGVPDDRFGERVVGVMSIGAGATVTPKKSSRQPRVGCRATRCRGSSASWSACLARTARPTTRALRSSSPEPRRVAGGTLARWTTSRSSGCWSDPLRRRLYDFVVGQHREVAKKRRTRPVRSGVSPSI